MLCIDDEYDHDVDNDDADVSANDITMLQIERREFVIRSLLLHGRKRFALIIN